MEFDYWNYRVVATKESDCWSYNIREVYYKNGAPVSWAAEPQYPCGESLEEVQQDLNNMSKAFSKPTLIEKGDKLVEKAHHNFKDDIIQRINDLKVQTQKETGSFKYDFCYDECIEILRNKC